MKNFICIAKDNINKTVIVLRVCTNNGTIESAKEAFWERYPFENYPVDSIKLQIICVDDYKICIPDEYKDMHGTTTEPFGKE